MDDRTSEVFAREAEWAQLSGFLDDPDSESRLMVVYGRRRQGKSLLLQELARVSGALYWEAALQSREQNLASFSAAWTRWTKAPGPLRFQSWEEAFEFVFAYSPPKKRTRLALFIDEIGYLNDSSPEVPSLLQQHFGPGAASRRGVRVILCGSIFAQMTRLLGAGQPLRGRHSRVLKVDPFSYRVASSFWGLDDNPDAAFRLHALIGGTPAYKRFAGGETPKHADIDRWVVRHLLDPSSPLYFEGSLLIAEDPTLMDKALYWSVLNAVADGNRRRGEIATAIGRPDTALSQPLNVLLEGAWIDQQLDPLHKKASTILLTEPMLRAHRLLIAPERQRLDRGFGKAVWEDAQPRLARTIYGPHLEWLAGEWALRHASPEAVGGNLRLVGSTILRTGGQRFQLDLVGVEPDRNGDDKVCVVGEVKAERDPVGVGELERLDTVIPLLAKRASSRVRRLLVGRGGFTSELRRAVRKRPDVELVDLERIYRGD